tara:strand:+ start:9428 stop:9901 length:474 start_codon:yes stop_codon:yes gene_type:complete
MAVTSASVSVNAEANIGSTLEVQFSSRGPQTWVYILNEDSNALTAGDVAMRNTTSTDYKVVLSSAGALVQSIRCVGVAQHSIPAGSYGYVLRRGIGTIQVGSGATVSDSEGLTAGGVEAGSIIKFAAGNVAPGCIIALAVQNIAAGATGLAFIDCRG